MGASSDPAAAETIAGYLAADHGRLEDLLALAVATPGAIALADYGRFRGGLLRHIGLEEKLLLPALLRLSGGAAHPQARQLHLEHGAIASLLVPTPTPAIIAALRAVLTGHNLAEERPDGLYASAARLPETETAALLTAMRARAEPPQAAHNDGPAAFRQIANTMAAAGCAHPPPLP